MAHLRLCTAHSLVIGLATSIGLASVSACDPAVGVSDEVRNRAPTADARVLGKDGHDVVVDYTGSPVEVTLDGSFSKDSDGSIKKYKWFSGTRRPGTGGAAGAAAGSGAAGRAGGGAGMAAGGAGGGAGMAAGGAGGGAGMAAGGAGMAARDDDDAGTPMSEQRWVPDGEDQDWPDDVQKPVVMLGEGEFKFVLWVEDDKGKLSNPSTLKVTVRTPVSPEVQMCAEKVYSDVPAGCKTCICGVSEACLTLTSAEKCDATCWAFLQCLATKCPDFRSGDMDTSCVTANCLASISGAAAAGMIAPCYTPCRPMCTK